MRILYRMRQFWRAFSVKPEFDTLVQARAILSPAQWELFDQLQPGEKRHALEMLTQLITQGENNPDLLVAALLHDVGKVRYPLNPLARAIVVLAVAIMPGRARRWGILPPGGINSVPRWRRAFVVAEQHPSWGADLARLAGVSSLAEALIREHHHPQALRTGGIAATLLQKLWQADNIG